MQTAFYYKWLFHFSFIPPAILAGKNRVGIGPTWKARDWEKKIMIWKRKVLIDETPECLAILLSINVTRVYFDFVKYRSYDDKLNNGDEND